VLTKYSLECTQDLGKGDMGDARRPRSQALLLRAAMVDRWGGEETGNEVGRKLSFSD